MNANILLNLLVGGTMLALVLGMLLVVVISANKLFDIITDQLLSYNWCMHKAVDYGARYCFVIGAAWLFIHYSLVISGTIQWAESTTPVPGDG